MEKQKTVYCHFSFRRPKGKPYGLFATALYAGQDERILVAQKTRALPLWRNHQHITAIQAYEHALYCLWEWQAKLIEHGVTNILLVTDNSILAGWIADPNKNKEYASWMRKANAPYRAGGPRELCIIPGLCEPRRSEKSHKYCTEDRVINKLPKLDKHNISGYKLKVNDYKSVFDIVGEDKPEGMELPQVDLEDAGL